MTNGDNAAAHCLLCGSELVPVLEHVFDTRFGLPDIYSIHGCRRCGLEHTLPRPDQDELIVSMRNTTILGMSRDAPIAACAGCCIRSWSIACGSPSTVMSASTAGAAMAGCWMWVAMRAAASPSIAPTASLRRGWS